ncbi:MAG: FAD-dependent oxidoreductase, partial [Rhodospirillales bacterium]|nr:FAD-dependent oxidoreductase [Rhodospirillales bacterium]
MAKYDYDMITIGAGSGGVRAARLAGGYGARSAICEEDRVGGTCVLRGCVPKKLLIYGAHFADHFEDSENYSWTGPTPGHDWPGLIATKNTELERLNGIYLNILKNNNVDVLEGRAILSDPHTVEIGGRSVTSEHILIAAGSWPRMPQIPGIEHAIDSREALDLGSLPGRMVIVGGGYIAVEFAGIFSGFGTAVTEIVRADTVLRGFDEEIRMALDGEMKKRGIDLRDHTVVESIEKTGAGYNLSLKGGGEIETDCVMYATGRGPNTVGL